MLYRYRTVLQYSPEHSPGEQGSIQLEMGDIEVKFIDEPSTVFERRDVCPVCCSQQYGALSDVLIYLEPI